MPNVTRSLTIAARPSTVWRWFESQDGLQRWLRPDIVIDVRIGGQYRMHGADTETWISGVVLDIVPEGRLVLSWLEEEAGWQHPARLEIRLKVIEAGTSVTLTHDGFAGIGTATWRDTESAYERGVDQHQILNYLAAAIDTEIRRE